MFLYCCDWQCEYSRENPGPGLGEVSGCQLVCPGGCVTVQGGWEDGSGGFGCQLGPPARTTETREDRTHFLRTFLNFLK